jgi:hypothetical protein
MLVIVVAFTPVVAVVFTPFVAIAFTPSPYVLLQVVTSTPIYTMEVNRSSRRIESSIEG